MKPYFFLILSFSFIFSSCFQDCVPQDIKVGSVALMPVTQAFMQKFAGKKLIFKDENGREIVFRDTSPKGVLRDTNRLLVRLNCNSGIWGKDKSHDFVDMENMRIDLTSDSMRLSYNAVLRQDLSKKADSSLLFDVFSFSVANSDLLCGTGASAVFSDRGFPARLTDTSISLRRFNLVKDTIIGNKRFQNINVRKNDISKGCSAGDIPNNQTPIEVFFNFKDGLVAFKTMGGKFWFLDRIE